MPTTIPKTWQLAQINVGTIKYPQDDARMHGFMSRLDAFNALAEQSPGFIWRLQGDSGNATDVDVGGEPLFLANMSVWQSVETLFAYVYESAHRDIMIQRREWFERPGGLYQALWWIPAGHIPTAEEGLQRIALLTDHGPTPKAFNFKTRFAAPGDDSGVADLDPETYCSGWE